MNIQGGMWCVGMAEGGIRLDGGRWRRSCGVLGDIRGALRFAGGKVESAVQYIEDGKRGE